MKLFFSCLFLEAIIGDMTDLITIIAGSGFFYFLFIHNIDFYRFIDIGIPGLILSSIFILLYKELLSFLLLILLENSFINLKGEFNYINYIGGSIYINNLIFNIIFQTLIILGYKSDISLVILHS